MPHSSRFRLAASAVVVALAATGGCAFADDGEESPASAGTPAAGASPAATPSESPARESAGSEEPSDPLGPLRRSDYRAALRELALGPPVDFEVIPVNDRAALSAAPPSELGSLPAVTGAASFVTTTYEQSIETLAPAADGSGEQTPASLLSRGVDGTVFTRIEAPGSPVSALFGDRCWIDASAVAASDQAPPAIAGADLSGTLPGALLVFDRYRPAESSPAGTTSGRVAMAAVGFTQLSQQLDADFGRVPIEIALDGEGRFAEAFLAAPDVAAAIKSGFPGDYQVRAFADQLQRSTIAGWRILLERRDSLSVQPPPEADILRQEGDTCG